jgi:hypothetical protein
MLWIAMCAAMVPHLYLNKAHAKQVLAKWKPQIAPGNILSVTGLRSYTNVVIAMEKACSGALVRFDAASSFFVVMNENNATVVSASLIPPSCNKDERSAILARNHVSGCGAHQWSAG